MVQKSPMPFTEHQRHTAKHFSISNNRAADPHHIFLEFIFADAESLISNFIELRQYFLPILLTFFPAAVLLTNYVESIKRENIKEIILMFSIFIPFIVFLSIMIVK